MVRGGLVCNRLNVIGGVGVAYLGDKSKAYIVIDLISNEGEKG